jgi:hypothetical protein
MQTMFLITRLIVLVVMVVVVWLVAHRVVVYL